MTVVEHLEELRYRLLVSVAAVVLGAILAYIFYNPILRLLKHPLDQGGHIGNARVDDLYVTGIATALILRVKVAAFAGFVFALPVVLFQFWRFITPGLEQNEKRFALPFVLSSVGLFGAGAYMAFWVAPYGIHFLLAFAGPPLKPLIHFTEYINFIMLMVLVFGLSFEYPLVLVFLAYADILSSAKLRKWRRYAVFATVVFAALATPQQDPFSNLALAVPLYLLYELTILVIRFAMKK
ncbi:MAG: twin-arginine translocase subunit TatC [Actinomycetota bacterium]